MKKGPLIGIIIILVLAIIGVTIYFVLSSFRPPNISNPVQVGLTTSLSPKFTFTSDQDGKISYSGDCTSSTTSAVKGKNTITFNSLKDGTYNNCKITITNAAKKEAIINIQQFIIDSIKPVTTINSNSYSNGNISPKVVFNFSCSDGSGSGCSGNTHYKFNGSSEQRGNSITLTAKGTYSLEYWNVDNAGNEETHHSEFNNIKVNKLPPQPSITTSDGYRNDTFTVRYNPTSSADYCYYTVNDGSAAKGYGLCSGVFGSINFSTDDEYDIIVYENDSIDVGYSDSLNITWDRTPPSVTITYPAASGNYNSTTWTMVTLGNYADTQTCQYSRDNSSWTNFNSCSSTGNYVPLDDNGAGQNIYIRGIDTVGNGQPARVLHFFYNTTN